jgi:hypothetical protein
LVPVAPEFDAWFARGAALDVCARFQTAQELAAALERVCQAPDPRASPVEKTLPSPGLRASAPSAPSIGALASAQHVQPPPPRSRLGLVALALLGAGALLGAVVWSTNTSAPVPVSPASTNNSELPPPEAVAPPAAGDKPAQTSLAEGVPNSGAPQPTAPAAQPPASKRDVAAPVRAPQPAVAPPSPAAAPTPAHSTTKPAPPWDDSFEGAAPAPAPTWDPTFN